MPRKFVVSPAPIKRQISKVAKRLLKLKKKPAYRRKLKAIDLEIRILKDCFIKLGNVKFP
jgi:hypothetical protein